jgi:DNA-binding MarR family transcriptional regulator
MQQIPMGQLLLGAFEWFDEGLMNELAAAGWPRQNRMQSLLFANLDTAGTRPAELARRLGVSRQAVHQTVATLEADGLLTMKPDPTSGRSKLVMLTKDGERIVGDALAAFERLEVELSRRIGSQPVSHLREALERKWGLPPGTAGD